MIRVRNVFKSFDKKTVLQNISLHIEKGEIFGIIGLSGAGKSTLVRLFNRLENIDSGEIVINGVNLKTANDKELISLRKKTSMIFQHFNLLSSRTVYGNVKLPLELEKMSEDEKNKRIMEVLKIVELDDKKDSYVNKLSGGQKQRVAIARALVTKPDIILSDESTSALDPITATNILELLKKINRTLGITIVIITHQMEVIKKMCDRIAVLKDGVIIEEGSTQDIFLKPKENFTRKLIGILGDETESDKNRYILHFLGTHANKAYISMASKEFGIDINVLGGNIHTLSKDEKVGYLIVKFDSSRTEEIIKWFNENRIEVEKLNG